MTSSPNRPPDPLLTVTVSAPLVIELLASRQDQTGRFGGLPLSVIRGHPRLRALHLEVRSTSRSGSSIRVEAAVPLEWRAEQIDGIDRVEPRSPGLPHIVIVSAPEHRMAEAAALLVDGILPRLLAAWWREAGMSYRPAPGGRGLDYQVLVHQPGGPLTIPQAVRSTRQLSQALSLSRHLPSGARLDVVLAPIRVPSSPDSPTGRARVARGIGWCLAVDAEQDHGRVWWDPAANPTPGDFALGEVEEVSRLTPEPARGGRSRPKAVHVQGLGSVSAEPEEGLLAAATIDELVARSWAVTNSHEADTWVYRTADAEATGYFQPKATYPMRSTADVPVGAWLVATGLGPAIDPGSEGGRHADTLLAGDEQGGRLIEILGDLSSDDVGPGTVFRHRGLAHRLDLQTVALSRMDLTAVLTPRGFNEISLAPDSMRRIYATTYDERLREYFGGGRRSGSGSSYLLFTSRGCGLGCSICCSGGYQPFQALEPARVIEMLRSIPRTGGAGPVEIFLLDSYFNMGSDRFVKLVDALAADGLVGPFEFYVRHSGVRGFLRSGTPTWPDRVDGRMIKAYRTLGIDEIVLGIDAYADAAIRVLKTHVKTLGRDGERAAPLYTFEDLRTVIAAIGAEGLTTRGFLLLHNPFLTDGERLENYWNLARLCLEMPSFRIDADSSDAVNVLKPLAGAPMTEAALQIPGLVNTDRFDVRSPLGDLESLFQVKAFGILPSAPDRLLRHVDAIIATRRAVAEALGAVVSLGGPIHPEVTATLQALSQFDPPLVALIDEALRTLGHAGLSRLHEETCRQLGRWMAAAATVPGIDLGESPVARFGRALASVMR